VIEQLTDDAGFALVAPAEVVTAAPAPLATIREQVKKDWVTKQATDKAQQLAAAIAAKATGKVSLADAVKQAGVPLPPAKPARIQRLQLSQMGDKVPTPLRVFFSTAEGKAQIGPDPSGGGFYIVKVNKIIPGNALDQPGLITEIQKEFGQPLAQEYAQQLVVAARKSVGVKRNEPVIEATRKRITNPAG